jgi:hypothetical protein
MLKKRECGYADAARLHTGRIAYCIKEEVTDEYGIGRRKRRTPTAPLKSAAIGYARMRLGIQFASALMTCKNWYSNSRTMSDDHAHRGIRIIARPAPSPSSPAPSARR